MKKGYRPQRTCLGCGARADKEVFVRLVLHNGELEISPQGSGRGGYLHRSAACWEALVHRKNLSRAFHVTVDRATRERLVRTLCEQH